MPSMDQIFALNGDALQLRSQRLNMLASNIANASTPGYKAKDLDFDLAMKQAHRLPGSPAAIAGWKYGGAVG